MAVTPRWCPAYVGLGSNLDSPADQLVRAFDALGALDDTLLIARSGLYRSAPVGPGEQPDFVNAAAALLTRLSPRALLAALQSIETAQGRTREGERWGPRSLDLDLLVYGTETADSAELTLPHPRITERNFVLLPLGEIAPHLVIPGLGSVASLADAVSRAEPRIERI